MASVNAAFFVPAPYSMGGRDRTDSPEPTSAPLPFSTTVAPSAPTFQALAALGATPVAAPAGASLVPPAGVVLPGSQPQAHSVGVDADLLAGDYPTSTAGVTSYRGDSRMGLDPSRSSPQSTIRVLMPSVTLAPTTSGWPFGADPIVAEAAPLPRGADLIADALPLAGDSFERGLEEFVRQLEAVDVAGIVTQGPTPLVVTSLTVAGSVAVAVVAREVVRRRSARVGARVVDPMGRELALCFPELPRSWSERH